MIQYDPVPHGKYLPKDRVILISPGHMTDDTVQIICTSRMSGEI